MSRAPSTGAVLGRYTLAERLGAGGMATVYKATDPHGDAYAIKILDPSQVQPEDIKRFSREYKAMSKLSHPHIVRVYESGVHQDYPWIAMEYVEGRDLESTIEAWRANPPADRFQLVEHLLRKLCEALQYVHERRLIHRDIKPSNILMTLDGEPKLSDFGVVKGGADGNTHITQLTMAGRLVGTVAFMAPELITSEDDIDPRVDLYSLGAMLYLMLCFRRPIEAKSVAGYLARHLTEVPPPAGQIDPNVPRNLEQIASRLLQKDRAHRYPNAGSILAALQTDPAEQAHTLQGRDRQLQAFSRRLSTLLEGAGGVVVVNGAPSTGKSHLLRAMADLARASHTTVYSAIEWTHDPLLSLAEEAGLDPTGSLGGALTKGIAASLRGSPAVVCVDDLDTAPRRSIDALSRWMEQAGQQGEALLLVATASSLDAISSLVTGHATGLPADLLPLGPINVRATISLLRDRGVLGSAGSVLGKRLHEAYGGLPGPMIDQFEALLEHGWFAGTPQARELVGNRSRLRQEELPVPEGLATALRLRLNDLPTKDRELLDLMAVVDRPATATLLGRCTKEAVPTARRLDDLTRQWLKLRSDDTTETYQLADPIAGRVLRNDLAPEQKKAFHIAIADALSIRRRRANHAEIAHHLHASGNAVRAYPHFAKAMKRAHRDGSTTDVLDLAQQALPLRDVAEAADPGLASLFVNVATWKGLAHLERREWATASTVLNDAVSAARRDGSPLLGVALGALGRAWYRLDDHRRARPLLEEAASLLKDEAGPYTGAARAIADILLQAGDLEASSTWWELAIEHAVSPSDQARGRRGQAHCRVFQGRMNDAIVLLDEADDLLSLGGDPIVRASVLTRSIELANATGSWGSAIRRAEQLVDVARRRELSERLPDAYSLLAQVLLSVGAHEDALDAASQAKVFADAHPGRFEARLRTARALFDLDRPSDAMSVLPDVGDLPRSRVDDPPALHAALEARGLARTTPVRARERSIWALKRPAPLLPLRGAWVALDTSKALLAAGQSNSAKTAAKRGLKILQGYGADGLRLEMLIALYRAAPDDRVKQAIRQVAQRIDGRLPSQAKAQFWNRSELAQS